jgi:hypothetical protein
MDEYIKLFLVLLLLVISLFILIKYSTFQAIFGAFIILIISTFIVIYVY